MPLLRRVTPVAGPCAVLGVLAAPAHASTVGVADGKLTYSAGAGEENDLRLEVVAAGVRITDDGASIALASEAPCTRATFSVTCSGVSSAQVALKDLGDAATVAGALPATIHGGAAPTSSTAAPPPTR